MTPTPSNPPSDRDLSNYVGRHLRFGWCSLLCFLSLGIVLETLHGFKIMWYLNVDNQTRQLMWRLAHAHGTLLSLVNVAIAATWSVAPWLAARWRPVASACLIAATILLPGGFFLGGLDIHAGDPGLGILLVPVGALALFCAVLLIAWQTFSPRDPAHGGKEHRPDDGQARAKKRINRR